MFCVYAKFLKKKKPISSNHVSSVRALYEAQIVSIQHQTSLQFQFYQKKLAI